jgi:hypothetical protein
VELAFSLTHGYGEGVLIAAVVLVHIIGFAVAVIVINRHGSRRIARGAEERKILAEEAAAAEGRRDGERRPVGREEGGGR